MKNGYFFDSRNFDCKFCLRYLVLCKRGNQKLCTDLGVNGQNEGVSSQRKQIEVEINMEHSKKFQNTTMD